MEIKIYPGKIDLSHIQYNSGVFYGDNNMQDWKTNNKYNAAIGRVNGDRNLIASRLNYLHDPDIIDLLIRKTES
ncbi:hypothetical protein [Desulfoscipio geothermicus]|uniref:Uncharacterized protein n=1 Tax=Desulfoscipio geothermicus DSM 3669 TaxID=1121426 RepID=A0A1I6DTQ2_9FIRM|nr:hypothetical protein [Desulfoscipio geothermicus]SFR08721.1 hypothetical protein SAMN05660706_11743 [Desulfoscipio geothermicus DSM 3669]